MEDILSLIDQTIKEHEQIMLSIQTSEDIANDVVAVLELERSLESFVPERLDDRRQSLHDLQQSLERVDKVLQEHFDREEKALLSAFEKRRKSIRQNLKFAWLFFGLGLLAGIILMAMLPNWLDAGSDILTQFLYSLLIIACILLLLIQGSRLRPLGHKYK